MTQKRDSIIDGENNGPFVRQIVGGIIVVVFAAVTAILSSRYGLGLLSIWPVFILFVVFSVNYELGLVCFVLSFAYQAPVVFAPKCGLAAIIRLDELIFISILPVWFLRNCLRGNIKLFLAPLTVPLLFYVLIAIVSLMPRLDTLSSTPFLYTATGFKGLGPLLFRLIEVVIGYIILTDPAVTQKTRTSLFYCLPLVAAFAIALGFFVCYGFLPKDIVTGKIYEQHYITARFSLYGNTGAWQVLLIIYFFVVLDAVFYFRSLFVKTLLVVLLVLCCEAVFISGGKTSIVAISTGLVFLGLKRIRDYTRLVGLGVLILVGVMVALFLINRLATHAQKTVTYSSLKRVYTEIYTGVKGSEASFYQTALGKRVYGWLKFAETVREEPEILLIGKGWHRRAMYKTGSGLHNDLLTACHDMGIPGLVFVVWLFFEMYRQFSHRGDKRLVLSRKEKFLRFSMQSLVIAFIASSFTSENLTFYGGGIDVQFPLMVMFMAVVWGYLNVQKSNVTTVA